ncbi:MAG: diaminopimelate epimerase [Bacteroidetes bacterium]|nr:diaminopimelate epimerase [Bacteroidota bacterium]
MNIDFYKYEGTGNDFIILDDRSESFDVSNQSTIEKLCDRRFGIGADGLMLLRNCTGYDFEMVYFNSDGKQSSMCGNGGRCIVAFANKIGVINAKTTFKAIDGPHEAIVEKDGIIKLKMCNVSSIEKNSDFYFLNTGSPHFVRFVKDIEQLNVFEEGRKVRYNDRFKTEGTNVNFVEFANKSIIIRTYERGVENETLSCGTGVTAAAIAAFIQDSSILDIATNTVLVKARGGDLKVSFSTANNILFENIWLQGAAKFVFKGVITI